MVENLREGQLRIIFFLENSPDELRSIVDEDVQSKIYKKTEYPRIKWDDWKDQSEQFQKAFERFAAEYGEDQGVEESSPNIA